MPRYKNFYNRYIGRDNLSIPPKVNNYGSIYYYNMPELINMDSEPWYNPIKQKYYEFIDTVGNSEDTTILLDLDWELIEKDFFIHITSIKHQGDRLNDIELFFNSLENEPSLFLSESLFCINNSNRIKKLYFIIKSNVKCEILVMISDKFLISRSDIGYSSDVKSWKV